MKITKIALLALLAIVATTASAADPISRQLETEDGEKGGEKKGGEKKGGEKKGGEKGGKKKGGEKKGGEKGGKKKGGEKGEAAESSDDHPWQFISLAKYVKFTTGSAETSDFLEVLGAIFNGLNELVTSFFGPEFIGNGLLAQCTTPKQCWGLFFGYVTPEESHIAGEIVSPVLNCNAFEDFEDDSCVQDLAFLSCPDWREQLTVKKLECTFYNETDPYFHVPCDVGLVPKPFVNALFDVGLNTTNLLSSADTAEVAAARSYHGHGPYGAMGSMTGNMATIAVKYDFETFAKVGGDEIVNNVFLVVDFEIECKKVRDDKKKKTKPPKTYYGY